MAGLSAVRAKVWLLHLQSSRGALGSLSFNVIREICSYFEDPRFFVAIYGIRMQVYDFKTRKTTQHTLPIKAFSGYIPVDRTTVLLVGTEVLTLDLLTLHITPLPLLLTPRFDIGVAQMGNTVFAFGGIVSLLANPMTVCEKSSIPPTHWTPLPHMHYARCSFTPCVFKALFYLASTYAKHRAVESFSPLTETFTVLPVALPKGLKIGYWGSVTFVANGELTLLTNKKQMARWKIESEAQFRVSATDRDCWSCHSPLIVRTEVYIANFNGPLVEKWSLKANKFLTKPPEELKLPR